MTQPQSSDPPSARGLPRWAKIASVGVAAVLISMSLIGVGMAVGSPTDSHDPMDMAGTSTPTTTGAAHHSAKHAKVDPARQAWAHRYGLDRETMPTLAPASSASPEQRAAAQKLLDATKAATAKYADLATAKAGGYDLDAALQRAEKKHPKLADILKRMDAAGAMPAMKGMPMLHVANPALRKDGKVLDPNAPETLMYEYAGHGTWKLVGVMFTAGESYPSAPPDPGGPITRWHYHHGADGQALMMHIFFVPDLAHAYATEMS